jgi:hypothetical protein
MLPRTVFRCWAPLRAHAARLPQWAGVNQVRYARNLPGNAEDAAAHFRTTSIYKKIADKPETVAAVNSLMELMKQKGWSLAHAS